jgi:PleD family two-component response regulator
MAFLNNTKKEDRKSSMTIQYSVETVCYDDVIENSDNDDIVQCVPKVMQIQILHDAEEEEHLILNDRMYVCNRKILIVDDEPFNIMAMEILIKMALQSLSLPVDIMDTIIDKAYNGKQALNKVKQSSEKNIHYGLILMDCSMPEMDGYISTLKIR